MADETEYYDYDSGYSILRMGLAEKSARMFMYFFNGLFFLFSSIMFSIFIFVHYDKEMGDYIGNIEFQDYYDATAVCACGGMVVMIASLVAYMGTYFYNIPLMIAYVVLTVIGFIINFTGAIYLLCVGLESSYAKTFTSERFQVFMYRYNMEIHAKLSVDLMQEYLGCCGAYSPLDWQAIHMPVPDTCRDQVTGNQYRESCGERNARYLEPITGAMSGIALWICFLQIFTLIFFTCMYRGTKERRRNYYQEETKKESSG